MNDEKSDMPDFAGEISKLLPVKAIYEDAAQPAARQAGSIGGDLMKVLHLALAPVQIAAAVQDRFRVFIDQSVRKVPDKRRIQPAPQIAGPVLEGIRYEPAGTEIDAMFSNLLANAMDAENHRRAHPAYPNIIKQLSRDETVCLALMADTQMWYQRVMEFDMDEILNTRGETESVFVNRRIVSDNFPAERLFFQDRIDFYMEHLGSLGLAGLYVSEQEPLYEQIEQINSRQIGSRQLCAYRLSALGKDFMTACKPPQT